jgi:hypothetical protein
MTRCRYIRSAMVSDGGSGAWTSRVPTPLWVFQRYMPSAIPMAELKMWRALKARTFSLVTTSVSCTWVA